MPFYQFKSDDDLAVSDGEDFQPDHVPRAIVAFGADLVTKGMELPFHCHRKAQLLLTLRGIVTCEADQSVWIVPPNSAVWIPGGLPHSMSIAGNVELYCLFVEPDAAPTLPARCTTLSISPLLKQLLLHISQIPEPVRH